MTVDISTIDFAAVAAALDDEPADPFEVRDELLWFIEDRIKNHPRSLQKEIGPSEVGHECGRWLGYKIADAPVFNDFARGRDQWRPTVGTAVHAWLADTFESINPPDTPPLFVVEHSLTVGQLSPIGDGEPEDVTGSGDLWYRGVALDWKIVGPNTLKKAKTISRATRMPHGPSTRYRKQVNLYGAGWRALGLPVHTVMIAMLPSAGELRADSYFWHEEYRQDIVDEAMTRLNATHKLMRAAKASSKTDVEIALSMLPTADVYCTSCPYFVPGNGTAGHSLAHGCPGDPGRYQRTDPILSILPPS